MKRHWRIWTVIGAVLVFATYLAWPQDEYAFLRQFHPRERIVHGPVTTTVGLSIYADRGIRQDWDVFEFTCDPKLVESVLPPEAYGRNSDPETELPTGQTASFAQDPNKVGTGQITCVVIVDRTRRDPWLRRTWAKIEDRLGFR